MNAMKKLICLLLMLCAGTAAFAWGGREHRLIAYIAEAHLTPRTRQVLDRYLDQSIVEYSTWMDRYRTAPGYEITTYWHMVTIDKDGSVPPEPLRPNGDGDADGSRGSDTHSDKGSGADSGTSTCRTGRTSSTSSSFNSHGLAGQGQQGSHNQNTLLHIFPL